MSTSNKNGVSGQQQPGTSATHILDGYTVSPQQSGGQDQGPYYNSAAPSVSLPKGGGALKGIDEKFSVNAVNGTAGVQVPLPLTPGRGGFTPSLSLGYNSGSGNSEFGLGWSLSLGDIRRRSDKRLPQYRDGEESDVFLLAGAEDLVPVIKSNGDPDEAFVDIRIAGVLTTCLVKRYRPRIEGLFARIEYVRSLVGHSWWRVTTADNLTTYYGLTAEGQVSDPEDASRVYRWLPQQVYDQRGNVQHYVYKAENFENVPAALWEQNRLNRLQPCTNKYLKKIRYANRTPQFIPADTDQVHYPNLPLEDDWLMEAVLDYGDHDLALPSPVDGDSLPGHPALPWSCRRDAFSAFQAGFEIRTWRLCHRVLLFHYFDELHTTDRPYKLVRSLDLTYAHGGGSTEGGLVEADFITSVTQSGYNWDEAGNQYIRQSLPAMTLDYQPLSWNDELKDITAADAQNAPQGLTGPYQWIDLWGEGLPGILTEQGGSWWYKENRGEGHFGPSLPVAEKPSLPGLGQSLQWQDLDADGSRQTVSHQPGLEGYFELNDDQEWEAFRAFKETALVDWSSPYTKMLDLNGDGRPDLLLAHDTVWTWYENEGRTGFATGGTNSTVTDEEKGPRLLLNDAVQSIYLADMNGDGLTDIVRVKNGEVCYWPNLGWGKFGAKVAMSNAPVFTTPDLFNPRYIQLTDISGTGAADIIYLGDRTFRAWINLSGNGFSEAKEIATLPGMDPYSQVALLDLLGNGTGCIVWSSPLPQHSHAPMRYIDLMGGIKPYLLNSYDNGMGKTVAVAYKSAARYYLADKVQGTPWATRLPFPVQCIDKVTTTDDVSSTTYRQTYSYHHGYYDHEEREFRGFGRVDTLDTDQALTSSTTTLDQPPVLTKTWYHTGAWLRERPLLDAFKEEYYHFEGWDQLAGQAIFPEDSLNVQELREAHRALKGSALRQEVYALDGTALQEKPYTVTVSAYRVKLVQPQSSNRYAAFLTYGEQSLSWSCERNPGDTRLSHSLVLEADSWGNVLKSAEIAYPRQSAYLPADEHGQDLSALRGSQSRTQIVYTVNKYTNSLFPSVDDAGDRRPWRMRLPWETSAYELHLPSGYSHTGLWTIEELTGTGLPSLSAAIDPSATPSAISPEFRLLSRSRTLYRDDDAATVLSAGVLAPLGLVHEQYRLAFTGDQLTSLFNTRVNGSMLTDGGYLREDSISGFGSSDTSRYWLPSGTAVYDASPQSNFYTPLRYRDPWGNETKVTFWISALGSAYWLLPFRTEAASGDKMTINRYNWYHLQPEQLTDMNDNLSEIAYDTLGLPVATALMGKGTEGDYLQVVGSTDPIDPHSTADQAAQAAFWTDADPYTAARTLLGKASWRCIYNLDASPVQVAMIARQQHWADNSVNANLVIRITYTDGLGRIAMHKATAADDPDTYALRWNASGRTVYNNKGKPVLQYEPWFSNNHHYDPAAQLAAQTVSPKVFYDPLGRPVRTELPDGSYSCTDWDNWSQTMYDANDTVKAMPLNGTGNLYSDWYLGRKDGQLGPEAQEAAGKALQHAGTPAVLHLDTLARPALSRQHNRTPDSNGDWQDEYIYSREEASIEGYRLRVIDGRGLTPLQYGYNTVGAPCVQVSIDGGTQYMLTAADGQPLYSWDAEDRQLYYAYDMMRRSIELLTPKAGGGNKVLQRWLYVSNPAYAWRNWNGRLVNTLDGAMLEEYYYNFKGQVTGLVRYPAYKDVQPDWSVDGYTGNWRQTLLTLDAFGQPLQETTLRYSPYNGLTSFYSYDRSGALDGSYDGSYIHSGGSVLNARGQVARTDYNNHTVITYSYDPETFRLMRQRTVRTTDSEVLQDVYYWYDAAGNITRKRDEAQDPVYFNNCAVQPENGYTYDALYRLIEARGREQAGAQAAPSWNDATRTGITGPDCNALQNYIQSYSYDKTGNMTRMRHRAGVGTFAVRWTRNFEIDAASNRLLGSWMGTTPPATPSGWDETYSYDARGNMTGGMDHLQGMSYNELNRLEEVVLNSSGDTAHYQYGSSGERFRKTISRSGGIKEYRIKAGHIEEYAKSVSGTVVLERFTNHLQAPGVHIITDYRTIGAGDGEPQTLARYQYTDQLQSTGLELDEEGSIITMEEYYPFGSTSFQGGRSTAEVSLKRYRYTGKERDEETGLNYHGARYYAPWLCRWTAVDPLESKYTPWSSYNYGFNNPITYNDPTGMGPGDENNWHPPMAAPKSVIGGFSSGIGSNINPISIDNIEVHWPSSADQLSRQPVPQSILKDTVVTPAGTTYYLPYGTAGQAETNINVDNRAAEAFGAHLRNSPIAAPLGYYLAGEQGAALGDALGDVVMTVSSNPGTPYGRPEIEEKPLTEPYIPKTEAPAATRSQPEASGRISNSENGSLTFTLTTKQAADVNSTYRDARTFTSSILNDPPSIWGKSVDGIVAAAREEGLSPVVYQSGKGSKKAIIIDILGSKSISRIQVHPGGGRHGGAYYKISTTTSGILKVVDKATYKSDGNEKAKIYFK